MDLVIFDCDGILVDSEPLALRANSVSLAEYGWPLTDDEILERFLGRSHAAIQAEVAGRLGVARAAEWAARFHALHHADLEEVLAVDGIVAALDEISAPTCVASSGTHEKLRQTLGRTGLYPRFEGRIFSATEVEHGKPAPDLFLHAAASLGVAPERCVVVEDSRYGVMAARAAGMRSLGYTGGVTPAAALEGPGTVLFDDMRELPELLRAL
ncbi:HAD family hydrolase [Longispora sp. K20-0274]|uniref:HAD family hydrolase n=1 Tax=Longispora sp. K20-0274 TaxID=3088255 RepID=UPI00399AD0F0